LDVIPVPGESKADHDGDGHDAKDHEIGKLHTPGKQPKRPAKDCHEGNEQEPLRPLLRGGVKILVERIWREQNPSAAKVAPFEASAQSDLFFDKLLELTPQNDGQREMQTRAVQIWIDLAQTRVLFAQTDSAIPMPFLAVLVFWLAAIFVSFGLFARPNAMIVSVLCVSALSAASAIFLILELGHPFTGLMEISSVPLSNALVPLGP
jgi:hypothetical protein